MTCAASCRRSIAWGDEKQVTFTLDGEPRTSPPMSPVTTALYQAMEASALAMVPTTTVIPFMSTGATDGAALRAHGIPTYGILPMPLPMEDELRMHGDNERVPVPALGWAAEFLYRCCASRHDDRRWIAEAILNCDAEAILNHDRVNRTAVEPLSTIV